MKFKKTYIISSTIVGTSINEKFFQSLQKYAKHLGAGLKLMECQQNYLDDLDDLTYNEFKQQNLDLFVDKEISLNENLILCPFKQSVNVVDPLSGMDSFTAKYGSIILPFPRHRFRHVGRVVKDGQLPRGMWCSGSISDPYYKPIKSGVRMAPYHVYGALIVEIESDSVFHVRQLQWDGKGFYDLTNHVSQTRIKSKQQIEGISLPDDHAVSINPKIREQYLGLIKKLGPIHIFHHDTLDGLSITHWNENKKLTKVMVNLTLEEEALVVAKHMKLFHTASGAVHHMVASNHNEHVDRYLEEGRYINDTQNKRLALELALAKLDGNNVFEVLVGKYAKFDRVIFHDRFSSFKLHGKEMLCHGDIGINGSKATSAQIGLMYNGEVVSGHQHHGEVGIYGNPVNGTMTHLHQHYMNPSGGSSHSHTGTLIYPNGKFTQIHPMEMSRRYE